MDLGKECKVRELCINCKHMKRDFSKPQNQGYLEYCCKNEKSDNCGVPMFFDDSCDDFEAEIY